MSISYSTESLGLASGSAFFGYVKNLFVDTTEIHVPLIGSGLNTPLVIYDVASFGGHLLVRLTSPLDSNITGALKIYVKNLTTGGILGYLNIGAGGQEGVLNSSSVAVNNGDQVAIVIVSTGGSGFVPFLSWEIGENE